MAAEDFSPSLTEEGDAVFPDLTFLRVLFGHESFDEVVQSFTDCYPSNNLGRALTPILFPKKISNVWAIA